MQLMKPFEYLAPATLDEAVRALAATPTARVLAGGTDLLAQLKGGRRETPLVVDVKRILANNEREVGVIAARSIPEEFTDRLDQIDIAIRPF